MLLDEGWTDNPERVDESLKVLERILLTVCIHLIKSEISDMW